jgi:UDP-N-acetylglucosamine acyltransferase
MIGDHNTIETHTVLGTAPQDIKSTSEEVALKIGDHNHIGAYVLISAGTDHGGGVTKIGDYNQLGEKIHIGHDVQMGNHCFMEEDAALGGHTIVRDYVSFGRSAAVHQFVKIGNFAKVEAEAALTQDVPPYCKVSGNRAKVTGLHQEMTEQYLNETEQQALSDAYHSLFESDESPKACAIKALEKPQPESVASLYQSIVDSKRGIPFRRKLDVNEKV